MDGYRELLAFAFDAAPERELIRYEWMDGRLVIANRV
jgi:hypothetical protein